MSRLLGALGVLLLAGVAGCDAGSARAEQGPVRSAQPAVAGTELEARDDQGRALHFRIDAVEKNAADADGDVSFYELSVREPSGEWARYCAPDFEGKSRAIPVKGSWDERGTYMPGSEERTTFACTSGAIGKCIRFGYKPWKTVDGQSLLGHHQACIRMVRADYCGDGRPHTKDGTKINVWDQLGIQKPDPEEAGHPELFEAAWGPGGAVFLGIPRWSDDVAAVVAECPDRLRGHNSGEMKLSRSEVEQRYREALVFNGRYVNEADRWFR